MNLIFKNFELKVMAELINELVLKGKDARWRSKFYTLIAKQYNEVETFKLMLIEEYAVKDDNGKLVFLNEETGEIDMTDDNKETYYDQLNILLNEEFIIECNEQNKQLLLSNAKVLLDGDFYVTPQISPLYTSWCDKFEEVVKYYEGLED